MRSGNEKLLRGRVRTHVWKPYQIGGRGGIRKEGNQKVCIAINKVYYERRKG